MSRTTPPSASLAEPPVESQSSATAASYASTETVLLSFPIMQGSFPQLSRADNLKTLLAVQDAIKGVIENQHKLLEKMMEVLSNQLRAEERLEALNASVLRVSDAFNDWKRKTESEGSMNACNE
ncbi:hypothetical protein VTK26DRAFT_3528 [Humicola hyalothermophila]